MPRFQNDYLAAEVTVSPDGKTIRVTGQVFNPTAYRGYQLLAANPIDRRTSYAGSALPFPCPEVAFQGTPNIRNFSLGSPGQRAQQPPEPAKEIIGGRNGDFFDVVFAYPNAYNTYDARTKVPPSVFVILFPLDEAATPIRVRLALPDPFPLRTLTPRPGYSEGPAFYARKEEVFEVLPATAERAMYLYGRMKEELGLA